MVSAPSSDNDLNFYALPHCLIVNQIFGTEILRPQIFANQDFFRLWPIFCTGIIFFWKIFQRPEILQILFMSKYIFFQWNGNLKHAFHIESIFLVNFEPSPKILEIGPLIATFFRFWAKWNVSISGLSLYINLLPLYYK